MLAITAPPPPLLRGTANKQSRFVPPNKEFVEMKRGRGKEKLSRRRSKQSKERGGVCVTQ